MDLLESIRVFRRVAELSSFSAAAHDLRTTQPTVSRAVAALEEQLGVQLVRRSTRALQLTEEGQRLLLGSRDVLGRMDELLAQVRGEERALEGPLRLAASVSMGRLILIPIVDRFTQRHPKVQFQIRLSDGVVDLIEENIDVAIRMGTLADSTLRAQRIGRSRFHLYATKKYLRAHGRPKSLDELHRHRLLFYTRRADAPSWPFVDEHGQEQRFPFTPHFEADGVDMVREAVLRGFGIAMLPSWMMIEPEEDKTVERLLDRHCRAELPLSALTTAGRDYSAKQRAFLEFLRAELRDIPALALRE